MLLNESKKVIIIWVFPKIRVPQNGWFNMENPIKMDDLGGKPTIFGNTHISQYSRNHQSKSITPNSFRCQKWRHCTFIRRLGGVALSPA